MTEVVKWVKTYCRLDGRPESLMLTEHRECSGHCCPSFILSADAIAILGRAAYDRQYRESDPSLPTTDAEFVEANMNFDGMRDIDPYTGEKCRSGAANPVWNCKVLGPDGKCQKYAERPSFCRRHGYQYDCEHPSCTLRVTRFLYVHEGPEQDEPEVKRAVGVSEAIP